MPRKLTTTEEIAKAWEKKRERDKKAQANWVASHHEEHLARMKAQYQRKKEKKAEQNKEAKENEAMAKEDVNAPAIPKKRKLRKADDITARIKAYKEANPSATQLQISTALSTSQSSVSRALKG
jgi:hypothetical protein